MSPSIVTGVRLWSFVYRMEHGSKVRSIREEVFGPHVALIPFKSNEDAARIYNDTDYGLSMAVITESFRSMRFFREECDFGMGYVNLPCIGAEVHLPFGGVKKSGNGHPSAAGLVDVVTHKMAPQYEHSTVQAALVLLLGPQLAVGQRGRLLPEFRFTVGGRAYVPDLVVYRMVWSTGVLVGWFGQRWTAK